MLVSLAQPVGEIAKKDGNRTDEVRSVQTRLREIGKLTEAVSGVCTSATIQAIRDFQDHFLLTPDGRIDPNGQSHRFLNAWSKKTISPGVQLPGNLTTAWDLVSPLLPAGSYCSSGFRSADQQRAILRSMYTTLRTQIVAKSGQKTYDSVATNFDSTTGAKREPWEDQMLAMVRATGQLIAKPGLSPHQRGKAFDVGGPAAIDNEQVRIAGIVARANPHIFSGKILKERNGCVHVEIK